MNNRNTTADDITAEVLKRFDAADDSRIREIMRSLVRHLHGFIKDVQLTEPEWFAAIQFLTRTGQISDEKRQEFIMLSDTLGVTMLVDQINHPKPEGATENTIYGPFHRDRAPELPAGANMAPGDKEGMPAIVSGRVLNLEGQPIAGALLDVWQADSKGMYDSQYPSSNEMNARGKFRTDREGKYLLRTVRPVHYSLPSDGPVGQMLRATNRHSWRPAHIHFLVTAEGYEPVTTHIFDSVDEYLESDTVFGVKESLIGTFEEHRTRDAAAERFGIEPPFCTIERDFVLKPAVG